MAIYKFPNLARQTENSTTTNYYAGLQRPNSVGDSLGNQTGFNKPQQPTNLSMFNKGGLSTTPTPNVNNSTTTNNNQAARWRNSLLSTGVGSIPEGIPDYLRNQWSMSQEHEGGPMVPGNAPTRSVLTNDGRRVVMLNDDGTFPTQYHAWGEGVDPTTSRTWDDDLGWVTEETNTTQNPEYQADRRRGRAVAGTVMTAGFLGGTALAGGFGAGAGATAGTNQFGNVLSGSSTTAGGVIPAAGSLAGGAGGAVTAGGVGPMAELGGVGAGTGGSMFSGANAGMIRSGANLAGSLYNAYANRQNEGEYRNDINGAANRADPWGEANRAESQRRLWELYKDPSSIANTPGYQFALEQGQQGINRRGASTGYYRSPNLDYQLSQFNQGLASTTYNAEMDRLMRMSGVQFDPGNAGNILARSADEQNNMRQSTLNSTLAFGGDVIDWFFS